MKATGSRREGGKGIFSIGMEERDFAKTGTFFSSDELLPFRLPGWLAKIGMEILSLLMEMEKGMGSTSLFLFFTDGDRKT